MIQAISKEQLLAQLFDSQQEAVCWFLPVAEHNVETHETPIDFEARYCNAAGARLLGVNIADVPGARLLTMDLINDNSKKLMFEQLVDVWQTGKSLETTYYSPGFDRYFNVIRSKAMEGILSVSSDRTEEIKAAQQRIEQTNLLNGVLNASTHGIFACEAIRNQQNQITDLRFIQVNRVFAQMLRLPAEEIIGKTYLSFFPTAKINGVFDLNCEVIETGKSVRKDIFYKGEGLESWYDISLIKLGENGLVITFNDITETKKDKQLIEASAAYLQTVINASQTGICLQTPVRNKYGAIVDFKMKVVNQILASYVGQDREALIGGLISEWFPSYRQSGIFEQYCQTHKTGEKLRSDLHYTTAGIDAWIDIMSTKVGDEVLVTFHDFTPLKQLQLQLEASVAELQRSNERLSEFAFIASHDLQEPLRKIKVYSSMLEQRFPASLGESGAEFINRIQMAVGRMQNLINDLLTYSQLNALTGEPRNVETENVISEVILDLEASIKETNASFKMDKLPSVFGDKTQLRQLFQNLISNALKFQKPGQSPEITITSRSLTLRNLDHPYPAYLQGGDYNLVEISDNGIGFQQQFADRIFQLFQRLHGRAVYEGTGIGLAIVKKVVENHRGYIIAESEEGKGATFKIFFPAFP